jgi:flagellar hook-associated protein 2
MTTVSSTSGTTATTATTSTANAITALGAGSGMDVQSLATNLVEAERAPRKAVIEKKITQSESSISGYAAVKFVLNDLKTAFSGIKDQSDFNAMTTRVSQSAAMAVTTTATASTGSHSVNITNLAKAQRSISGSDTSGFALPTTQLNGGVAFSLVLSKGNGPTPAKVFSQGTADVTTTTADPNNNGQTITTTTSGTKSTSTLTFAAMARGESVKVNGLTFTANKALTASEVGEAFANLNASNTADLTNLNTGMAAFGSYSGSFAAGYASETNASGVVVLRSTSNGAADITAPTSFNTIEIGAASTTPAGMVAAINSSTVGISAQLINTGNAAAPYRIVITGGTGTSNSFSLSSKKADGTEVSNVNFGTRLQTAENATLTVDGVAISSSTNKVTDAIAGTTLELFTTTSGAANLDFTRDTTTVKTNLKALVTAYNDANSMLSVVSDPKSTVETYGATLVGNSMVSSVRTQMRNMVTTSSNTPSGNMTALRDIGITLNRTGELEIDQVKMDAALQNNYDQVVTMLTANKENQSPVSTLNGGVSNEAVKKLTSLLDASSPLTTQSTNLTTKISKYKAELDKLETRMTELLARYKKQFAAMESMVGETKTLQTSLKSSFDGMMSTYTNK